MMSGKTAAEDMTELRMELKVNEIFGPTVQGEGPSAGRRCAFIRLSGCNLTCAWCDTPYTWDWTGLNGEAFDRAKETNVMSVYDAHHKLTGMGVKLFVISGGEPMMQQDALGPLVERLTAGGAEVEIETNGTIVPRIAPTRFNVSPKLAHSKVTLKKRFKPAALSSYVGLGVFKFVCQTLEDLDEVAAIRDECGIPDEDIWIMPEGRDPVTLQSHATVVTDAAIEHRWNVTSRLHVLTWGDKRGV